MCNYCARYRQSPCSQVPVSLSAFSSGVSSKLFVMSGRWTKRTTSFPISSGSYPPATLRRRYQSRFSCCHFFFISLYLCLAVFVDSNFVFWLAQYVNQKAFFGLFFGCVVMRVRVVIHIWGIKFIIIYRLLVINGCFFTWHHDFIRGNLYHIWEWKCLSSDPIQVGIAQRTLNDTTGSPWL